MLKVLLFLAASVSAFTFNLNTAFANPIDLENARVYKILRPTEWADMTKTCQYKGTTLDRADGFIHLASREQVDLVISRYFRDVDVVYVLEYEARSFGPNLRWEALPSGETYPHLYHQSLEFRNLTAMSIRPMTL